MSKLGLKLWSKNTDYYYDEAIRLYNKGLFDYIELYVVPGTTNTIDKWKKIGIPINLHAPHFDSGVNLAIKEKEEFNIAIYNEVKAFEKILQPDYTVVHAGIEGNPEEVVRQLKIIQLDNILIENKPLLGPTDITLTCRGVKIPEIEFLIGSLNCGFCLDISHAMCTANSLKIDPYEYIKNFEDLKPEAYHICDNFVDSEIDKHLHFNLGTINFNKIFEIINIDKNIAIETNKNSKTDLYDFEDDISFIKEKLNKVNYEK